MQENAEYCDGQDFVIVFVVQPPTTYEGGFQVWLCRNCAYQLIQHPISDEVPTFPAYHPKPIPMHFTVSDEQKTRLKGMVQRGEDE
jgi:hypothetical protein